MWSCIRSCRTSGASICSECGVEGKPERRCFITSLDADAKAFRKLVRGHWGVENRLHWVLDVVFLEDQCRARTGHAPEN